MGSADEMMRFQIVRRSRILLKRFLEIMENHKRNHDLMLVRLKRAFPEEYHKFIDLSDYLSDEQTQLTRKAILDAAGDCERDLLENINNFDINFNFNQK